MAYIDIGGGDVLVLIHGLGSRKESWKFQMDLAEHYRLIIPDLRGHGENNHIEGISISTFADDVLLLLDELKIKKASFCGLSMGGLVVQEIYKKQPNRVEKLILSNTFSYSPPLIRDYIFFQKMSELKEVEDHEYERIAARKCLYQKDEKSVEEALIAFKFKREVYKKSAKEALKVNYLCMLPFIKVPTLVIGSLYDEIVPVLATKQSYLYTPKAEYVVFNKSGHIPNFEHKEEYNQALKTFLMKKSAM